MSPASLGTALAGLLFALLVAWLGLLDAREALAPGMIALWGEAIALAEGAVPVGHAASTYPPLPASLSAAWQAMTGHTDVPGPALLAAALAALLGAIWWAYLGRAGLGPVAALLATLLLVLHPFTLWLVAEGPGPVLVAAGLSLLAIGLARLRRRAAAPDAMLAGAALALLVLADPAGIVLAIIAAPFIALVQPPELLARAPGGLLLILLFPLLAALGGLAFVALIFGGDPGAPLEALGTARPDAPWPAPATLLLPLAGLPVLLALAIEPRGLPPLRLLGIALAGLALSAPLVGGAFGLAVPMLDLVAPTIGLAATGAALLIRDAARPALGMAMLAAGFAGGIGVLPLSADPGVGRMRAALGLAPAEPDAALRDIRALAAALEGRTGVAVDLRAAPELIAARGTAAGLIAPEEPDFALAARVGRLTAPVVVVRGEAGPAARLDRIRAAFPALHGGGQPGYALVGEYGAWRVYERLALEGDRR